LRTHHASNKPDARPALDPFEDLDTGLPLTSPFPFPFPFNESRFPFLEVSFVPPALEPGLTPFLELDRTSFRDSDLDPAESRKDIPDDGRPGLEPMLDRLIISDDDTCESADVVLRPVPGR